MSNSPLISRQLFICSSLSLSSSFNHSIDFFFTFHFLTFLLLLRMHTFTCSCWYTFSTDQVCLNKCCTGLICCDCLHKWVVVLKPSSSLSILMNSGSNVWMPTFSPFFRRVDMCTHLIYGYALHFTPFSGKGIKIELTKVFWS